ncbi:hypothetical protein FA15DRAFT_669991, partial [Coprinopsis marcescibilis]
KESEYIRAVLCQEDSPIYRLVDFGKRKKPINMRTAALKSNQCHVYVCPPIKNNWERLTTQLFNISSTWCMKPFSWPELYALFRFYNPTNDTPSQQCNIWDLADLLVGDNNTVTDVALESMSLQERFTFLHILFGGSARNCFTRNPGDAVAKLNSAIRRVTLQLDNLRKAWEITTLPWKGVTDQAYNDATQIIIPWPSRDGQSGRHLGKYSMASIHVVKSLAVKNPNAIWSFINIECLDSSILIGANLMFEHLMHWYLLTPTFCKTSHELHTFENPRRKISINFDFTKAIRFDSCTIIKDRNVYYSPLAWNFPGFDSCAIVNNELYLFQMTLDEGDRPFNADCLAQFQRNQLEMKVNLIFVMPEGRVTSPMRRPCSGNSDKDAGCAKAMTQYVLEIPLRPRKHH